ncbi:MarR family winged helix-turn-helix transcriptional regulator [Pseudonocardia sp. RS010]|uniref:MarR family winged helix-turn-helix transcriptional regulator n=1 Tax=Pseudonocardia sp. RS010 TaxID=3385979 RepID=UPI0039A32B61
MVRATKQPNSGTLTAALMSRDPDGLSAWEIAAVARSPLTMLGTFLRRTHDEAALSPAQSLVLSQLLADESLPISHLAAADGRAVSTMTEIVRRLVEAGYVTKEVGAVDRRQVRVSLTEAGRAALAGNLKARNESLAARIADLSAEDRVALARALPALWSLARIDWRQWPRMMRTADVPRRRRRSSGRSPAPDVERPALAEAVGR